MAEAKVDIGSSDQSINPSNYGGDALALEVLGSHKLIVSDVYASGFTVAGTQASGTPTFAVQNGANLTLDFSGGDVSGLSGVNYEIADFSQIYVAASSESLREQAANTITFTGNGGGVFLYNASMEPGEKLTTFVVNSLGAGDVIGVLGRNIGTLSYNAADKVATLEYPLEFGRGEEVVRFEIQNISQEDFNIMAQTTGTVDIPIFVSPVCFLRGTLIDTPTGEVAVEKLVPGDTVIGRSGHRTVKWVGFRNTYTYQIPADRRGEHMPVRIVRDAISPNVPSKDIVVSPGHHLYVDGKLVRAKDLINDKTIYQEKHHVRYDYFHVELDQFDVIRAHGIMSESWADGGNRDYFQNADVAALRPDDRQRRQADRPGFTVVRKQAEIQRLQATYAARAEELEAGQGNALNVVNG